MLSIDELAKQLNVSRNTALRLVLEGKIKAIKVGRQYRIQEEQLNQFITASEVPPSIRVAGSTDL